MSERGDPDPRSEQRPRDHDRRRRDNDPEKQGPRKEPHGAWLVVRYDTSDFGARPVPSGDVFWLSPDIWITGGTGLDTIIEGVPFSIHARVWNLGSFPASPTSVEFAIVDPALGIGVGSPFLIGTAWIPYLGGLSTTTVTCPTTWTRDSLAGGHPCLLVKASSVPFDSAPPGYNSYSDRHTGQQNLTVVPAGTGSTMSLRLTTTIVLGGRTKPQLAGTALIGARAEDLLRPGPSALRNALTLLEQSEKDQAPVALRQRIDSLMRLERTSPVDVESFDIRPFLHIRGLDEAPPVLTARRADSGAPAILGDIPVKLSNESRSVIDVDLTLPDVGADLLVNIWQLEDGVPTGGYTVLSTRNERIEPATDRHGETGTQATADPAESRRERSDSMDRNDTGDEKGSELEALVIAQFPAVHATLEIARQLAPLLPIRSAEELRRHLDNSMLQLNGEKFDISDALSRLPEDIFPIEDNPDLVAKTTAAVRIGSSIVGAGWLMPRSEELARIALDIAATPTAGRTGIPAGHFAGPSLFGFEREA